jgi:hypothetical protein
MVQVTLRVRPTSAYHAPNKVETITIDSHERLEKIQEKYTAAGSGSKTRLYFEGIELPLNSSVGSQNFSDNDVLECCRSPAISAALSACMKDLEEIKKLSYTRRHPGVLKQVRFSIISFFLLSFYSFLCVSLIFVSYPCNSHDSG